MLITKLTANVYRVVLGSNEIDTFYVAKSFKGAWKIANNGQILDFAATRQEAINLAINLHKEVAI